MKTAHWSRSAFFLAIFAWSRPAVAQPEAGPHAPGGDLPPDRTPEVRLSALPGFADEGAFVESVTSRVAELQQQAADADDPQRKAAFLLAAANLILAEQLEPACTRRFFQLDPAPQKPVLSREGDDALAVAPALARSDVLIAEAEASLRPSAEHDPSDENPPTTEPRGHSFAAQDKELHRTVETLKAFAQALRAYLTAEADADPARTARRAASGLSVLLEDDNPQVAAAAAFWQACLRAMDPDPTPALAVLDPAVIDPPPDSLRFGFFSRLLRCRVLAAGGGSAAALALLLQVEERANDWFKAEAERADAVRACAWLRLRILQDWRDRLDSTSQVDERTWCSSQMETLRAQRFSDARSPTVMRLSQAIPIIARPPGPIAPTSDGTPAPP
ncbi:MAG: hypothetical protein V1790_13425 [Planctomycetota bacterium]